MARKKAAKKHHVVRRRRMGAMAGKTDFTQLLFVVGGAVAANVVQKIIPDNIAGIDMAKFKAAIPVVIGVVLPMVSKNPIAKQIGLGMVAGGGATLLHEAGIIGAIIDGAPYIAAYDNEQRYLDNMHQTPMVSGQSQYCG